MSMAWRGGPTGRRIRVEVTRMDKQPPTDNSELPPQPQTPDAAQAFLDRWAKLPKGALARAIAKRDAADQAYLEEARAAAAKADQAK